MRQRIGKAMFWIAGALILIGLIAYGAEKIENRGVDNGPFINIQLG